MKFEYNHEISLGAVLQIATILVATGAGFSALQGANQLQDQVLAQHEKSIHDARILVRETQDNLNLDLKEIQLDVKKLDEKLTTYIINESLRRNKQ